MLELIEQAQMAGDEPKDMLGRNQVSVHAPFDTFYTR
jgi:hypothetical protein